MRTARDNFIDQDGIVKTWPAKKSMQIEVLKYIAKKFDLNKNYAEKEVNDLLANLCLARDGAFIRRELVESNLLQREKNCSKYWRVYLANLPTEIQSTNLVLKSSKIEDLVKLQQLFLKFNKYMEKFNGITEWKIEDVELSLKEGNLPPNGVKERYQHKSIYCKDSGELVGYMDFYNGHPIEDIYYIPTLYIDGEHQKKGWGKEIVEEVCKSIMLSGFSAIRLGVDITNWRALYFWYSLGFSKITKLSGDKVFADNHYMRIELERGESATPLLGLGAST
ncbi:MAG: GNAT family N-acetyltransferase [Oligoflexia bacterium]|nr:GNAT family N-acetyltransferase [Oligoflexia bacterium]